MISDLGNNDDVTEIKQTTNNLKSFFSRTSTSLGSSLFNRLDTVQNNTTKLQNVQKSDLRPQQHDATVQSSNNNSSTHSYLNFASKLDFNFDSNNFASNLANLSDNFPSLSANNQESPATKVQNIIKTPEITSSCPSDTELPDSDSEDENQALQLKIFGEITTFSQVQAFIATQKLLQAYHSLEASNKSLLKSLKLYEITPQTVDQYLKLLHQKIAQLTKEREASVLKYVSLDAQILKHRESAEANEKLANQAVQNFSKQKTIAEKAVSEAEIAKLELKQNQKQITDAEIKIGQAAKQISVLQKSISDIKTENASLKKRLQDTENLYVKSARELKQAKEETAQIRENCNDMIKTYQNSEETESKRLKIELADLQKQFEVKQADFDKIPKIEAEIQEMREKCQKATDQAVIKSNENSVLTNEIKMLEEKSKTYENILNKQKEKGNEQQELFKQKSSEIVKLNLELKNKDKYEERVKELEGLLSQRESEFDDIDSKLKEKSKFCQDLTENLAEIRTVEQRLKAKNEELTVKMTELQKELLESQVLNKVEEREGKNEATEHENGEVLKLKTENSELKKNLSRLENNLKSSGKSYEQKIRNLKKEFTRVTRELDGYKKGVSQTISEVRDRSGSVVTTGTEGENQVDVMSTSSKTSSSHRETLPNNLSVFHASNTNSPLPDDSTIYQQYENIDKPLLIDKILRIQKLHHKKNDKIEQLLSQNEDHAKELKKQSLVIKHLLFKIPADARETTQQKQKRNLASENPGLLLEMNAKLQVLLEDTISQNAALKENLKTLGNQLAKK